MNRQTSARFTILLFGGVAGLVIAIIAGRPWLVAAIAPTMTLVVLAAGLHQWPDLEVSLSGPTRAVVGDQIDLVVSVSSQIGIPWLNLRLELPSDLKAVDGIASAIISVAPGRQVDVQIPVELTRWGVARPGRLHATARDRFGMFISSTVHSSDLVIRTHPADGHRHSIIAPARLRTRVGAHLSPRHGEGTELAEVRPFRTGDSVRAMNWKVSARKGEPWITVRHPDRSGDLVLLLDSFTDIGPEGNHLVQRAVRAAMTLADSNLGSHDRVGLLDVGRHIRWFRPRLGRLHQARLFDRLLETQVEPGLRAPRIGQLPLHELSDGTLIVVISGLIDANMSTLPIELASRGLEVVVLDCSADDHLPPSVDRADGPAARLWGLERAKRRSDLSSAGVTVVSWSADQPLDLPVAALARRGRARGGSRVRR